MRPKSVKPNDRIAIVAPSGRIFAEEIKVGIELIKSWRLEPVLGKHLFEDFFLGYHYAGTDKQRTEDLQSALDNDEISVIWFARGGYGAVHLLDKINWTRFIEKPKWLIGYSDITAFHNHLNNFNVQTLHAITIKRLNLKYNPQTFETVKTVIFGKRLNYQIKSHPYNQLGMAKGKLVGGNLSLIYSLMGSDSEIKGENLILFIEDWCENWYHLDRMLMNLKRAGLFNRISGMIIGNFTRMDIEIENPDFMNEFDPISYEIIHNFMKDYKIPVCFGFPVGHTGDNRALIMGTDIKLEINSNNSNIEF